MTDEEQRAAFNELHARALHTAMIAELAFVLAADAAGMENIADLMDVALLGLEERAAHHPQPHLASRIRELHAETIQRMRRAEDRRHPGGVPPSFPPVPPTPAR